ncbi:ABC transporter permease [Roseinatronobacter sp. S2]|uniref:ABC transporter permease n=1 Tax=Roseinatronobacter sp. S2 TaxID=3035471 RepID=UPI00240F8EAD|nr:ABC transporter permease [Roseinatronobacter sp. S2]WFE73360.1 ABC transporter permease [Roseinatronobacter sp. S2]
MTHQSQDTAIEDDAKVVSNDIAVAGQWSLVWRKFKKHKLAMIGAYVVGLFYLIAIFAEFLAPQLPNAYNARYTFAPPQTLSFIRQTDDGIRIQPHVYGYTAEVNPDSGRRTFSIDEDEIIPVGFFVKGANYRMWGLFTWNRHIIGPKESGAPMHLLGTDHLGRDVFSRTIYGTRVSMTIGLVGVSLSLILGVILGGISGYFGGWVDNVVQRTIEFLQSIPSIPLWMGLAAAIPQQVSPLMVYFLITVILSVLGWTGLARVVRGKFYALKTEDFVIAAQVDGVSNYRVISRHMVPSFLSHIIATVTLAVPSMIIAETALSFLGLGLRAPVVSWGVLLQQAQSVRVVADAPWLLMPGLAVVVVVLGFNFLGDGMRDAADPYAS